MKGQLMQLGRWMFIGALALAPCSGFAQANAREDVIERLTDAVVEAMPIGQIFDLAEAQSPLWPMQQKPEALTGEQLACVRGELSSAGYRRLKRAEVVAYAEANPSRTASDLQLLEAGAATLMGRLVMGGAQAASVGAAFDERKVLVDATTAQTLSLMKFFTDPDYAALRKLSGVGDSLSVSKSKDENEAAGKQVGQSLGLQHMITAMGTCKVPPAAYL
jgi:hypothetical protein